jgi:hypothetical protein
MMELSNQEKDFIRNKFMALTVENEQLKAEIAELKKDAYRYRFVRSTVVDEDHIPGYDKSVDEHIRKRNANLN